ncbi:carboxypeptidase regulatory-like domain-containing protein [Brevibacillus sp. SYSU BS000544]|uniref:carboxypeptidase regulatory-like domain-containing protein n=1 Tax=Brevibacillus sp. SYSU BS000544 TaxID=3416443 RepID=UPI003CE57DAA
MRRTWILSSIFVILFGFIVLGVIQQYEVPLRFVSENSGYKVSYSNDHGVTTIQIGDGGGGSDKVAKPTPTKEKIEPYVVKGQVVDKQGHPQPGVMIYADNQLLYNSNILGVTDENGRYRIELERIATSWNMSADIKHEYNGKMYGFNLSSDTDLPFAGNTGAIRNFTWKTANGNVLLYTADFTNPYDENLPPPQVGEIEVTLTPVSPLLDGSTGQTITKRAMPIAEGYGLSSVPIGRYKATARWVPDGQTPVPMLINVRNTGQYAESIVFDFQDPYELMIYSIELEVKLP